MKILIVVESCFGNTARIADAVAAGLRSRGDDVTVADAATAPSPEGVDLLLVGAPTHNIGLPTPRSREQAHEKSGRTPTAGVAEWLAALPRLPGLRASTFATVTGTSFMSGSAAKAIAKRLRRHRADVVDVQNFLVGGTPGPLADGEQARAEQWGASLVVDQP